MPPFHQHIEIDPTGGSRSQPIIALVDPASAYAVIPAAVLIMLGIEPQWTQEFQMPGGTQVQRQLAEIKVRLEGQERITVCVFGDPESDPVLGNHTLDGFGLTADEANEVLVPARLKLG